jgi:hypothetical protein
METPRIDATPALHVVNAYDIYIKDLPPTKWYVGNILHEGAALLCGDPKVGKSFFALQIALAVAGNEDIVCGSLRVGQHGRVLYLALDDGSEKRIHDRLRQLTDEADGVKNLDFVYQRNLPSLSQGLDELLDRYLGEKSYVLVILDTFGAVLEGNSAKNVYRLEYQEGIRLQKLAQKHGICLLILHHTNKGETMDPVRKASGSHGLTGAVDSVLLLTRQEISARPRDGEESIRHLQRLDNGSWQVNALATLSETPALALNPQREAVKKLLTDSPKSRADIAAELRLSADTARKRLQRMEEDHLVRKLDDGRYEWADSSALSGVRGVPTVQPVQVSTLSEIDLPEQTPS